VQTVLRILKQKHSFHLGMFSHALLIKEICCKFKYRGCFTTFPVAALLSRGRLATIFSSDFDDSAELLGQQPVEMARASTFAARPARS